MKKIIILLTALLILLCGCMEQPQPPGPEPRLIPPVHETEDEAQAAPPAAVIKAFEDEGFIWGGRWAIWDNMHFEYHPELFVARQLYGDKLR